MTDAELDDLDRLCNKITPQPWRVIPDASGSLEVLGMDPENDEGTLVCETYIGPEESANACFIAAARTALPELIQRIRELEKELADARR